MIYHKYDGGSYPNYDMPSYIMPAHTGGEGRIHYTRHLALAHEVAHAIEYKLYGRTSEYGAWKLAYSFLKPQYWDEAQVNKWYRSYKHRQHFEWVLQKSGRVERARLSYNKYPLTVEFRPHKVDKRTREVLNKILADEEWTQEKLL